MAKFAIIGVGKFGFVAAKLLFDSGKDVIAIDREKEKIQAVQSHSTEGIIADATDKQVLEKLGLEKMDAVIVSVGKDVSASILITLFLHELNVKKIIVKSVSEDHSRALSIIGATETIFPEKFMAEKLVQNLVAPNILDYFNLSPEYSIMELTPPGKFVGKSLSELNLRNRYKINVIAVRDVITESLVVNPSANFVIKDSDILVVLAKREDVEEIM